MLVALPSTVAPRKRNYETIKTGRAIRNVKSLNMGERGMACYNWQNICSAKV